MNSRGFRDIVEGDGLHGEAENGLLHGSPGMRGAYASQGSQGRTVHVGTRDRLDVLVVGEIPRSVYSKRRETPHLLARDMCNDRNSRDPRGDAPPRPAHTATLRSPHPTHYHFTTSISSHQTPKARDVDPLRNLHAVRQFRLVPAPLVVLQALHADHQHRRELFDRRQHLRVALAVASREK